MRIRVAFVLGRVFNDGPHLFLGAVAEFERTRRRPVDRMGSSLPSATCRSRCGKGRLAAERQDRSWLLSMPDLSTGSAANNAGRIVSTATAAKNLVFISMTLHGMDAVTMQSATDSLTNLAPKGRPSIARRRSLRRPWKWVRVAHVREHRPAGSVLANDHGSRRAQGFHPWRPSIAAARAFAAERERPFFTAKRLDNTAQGREAHPWVNRRRSFGAGSASPNRLSRCDFHSPGSRSAPWVNRRRSFGAGSASPNRLSRCDFHSPGSRSAPWVNCRRSFGAGSASPNRLSRCDFRNPGCARKLATLGYVL